LRVEQIIWNLLTNAVKFTPADGLIRVAMEAEGDFARVTVADSGCGIAAEFLPHVFGMFNQAHLEVTPPNGGLGIGLALVHELAHAQGGRAEVASPGLGQGATFTVWLPLSGAEPTQASDPSAAPQLSLDGWRVLAVDDYIDGLLPFAEVLRLEGATVDVAQSARQALELLATNTYDLLISDLGMPEMDGYQFISQVRRQPLTQGLPAIAMSGFGRRVDARKALNAGFNAHVPKPASVEEIKAALARL
jgi:two-component system CheB/CheR fusion protein